MPRTNIPVNTIPKTAAASVELTQTAADHANGMAFKNNGRCILTVTNGGGAAIFVKITSVPDPTTGRSGDIGNLTSTISVGNGKSVSFRPLPPILFNQRSGDDVGKALVDFSGSTSVTVNVKEF